MGSYSQVHGQVQSALDWYRSRSSQALSARHIGGAFSVQGAAALALGKIDEAEHLLQESIAAYQEIFPTVMSVHPYSSSGLLYISMNQPDQAKEHLRSALKIGVEINSAMAHIFALPGVALLLAEKGDLEVAVEIYALSMRYPWISNSRWQKDLIEPRLTTLTTSLPPEVIAAARKRGRDRDLENTVQELLAKLA